MCTYVYEFLNLISGFIIHNVVLLVLEIARNILMGQVGGKSLKRNCRGKKSQKKIRGKKSPKNFAGGIFPLYRGKKNIGSQYNVVFGWYIQIETLALRSVVRDPLPI